MVHVIKLNRWPGNPPGSGHRLTNINSGTKREAADSAGYFASMVSKREDLPRSKKFTFDISFYDELLNSISSVLEEDPEGRPPTGLWPSYIMS